MVRILAASVVFCLTLPQPAGAAPGPKQTKAALDLIQRTERDLRGLVAGGANPAALDRAIAARVRAIFDMRAFARSCARAHWASMSAAQRDELAKLLGVIVERRYAARIRRALRDPIGYLGAAAKGDSVVVRTRAIERRGRRAATVRIDYEVIQTAKGPRVVDIVTDTVSLASSYRSTFNRVIRKSSVDALLGKLRKKAGTRR